MEKPVRFYSETVPIAGVLFLLDGLTRAERRPGIVLCQGVETHNDHVTIGHLGGE